ncbi:nuclear transport factor 2 family protein [Sphingobium tyrosinilyticum]|uniref:Nuclear transport factor 2 family protein n=1 Tax=Sphingobium tyrosinilyticum TaxID=2715436 RepID=A0ABV9F4F1_9SPHN
MSGARDLPSLIAAQQADTDLAFQDLVGEDRMEQAIADLLAKQEITETIYRIARGIDRGQVALYADAFHPDGQDFHGFLNGPVKKVLDNLANTKLIFTQHMIGNVLVELDGEVAQAESYFTSFHQGRDPDGTMIDETLRGRYLDRFERRDGGPWKIARRVVLWDWTKVEPSGDTWVDRVLQRPGAEDRFIYGRRDREDMVFTGALPAGFEDE